MKSGKNSSSGFREKVIYRFQDFIPVHSPGARADNPRNFDGS